MGVRPSSGAARLESSGAPRKSDASARSVLAAPEDGRTPPRPVTVFELEDLVKLAEMRTKEVILMARQCAICGRTRAEALRPLLTNPSLKVFSTLILDAATARELLKV